MSELLDYGIYLQIIGIILALGPTKYYIAIRIFEIYLIMNRNKIITISENRPPKSFQEKLNKISMKWQALKEKLDEVIDESNYDELVKIPLSRTIGGFGILMVVVGLILQLSFWQS